MAKSFSNCGEKFFLDVTLIEPHPGEPKPYLSITSPHFPNENIIEFIKSEDQQLIYLDTIIEEFINEVHSKEDLMAVAEYFEMLLHKIRESKKYYID